MKTLSFSFLMAVALAGFQQNIVGPVPADKVQFKDAIKVYPTPNNKGSITISSANHATLSFYLFDLDGTLVYQTTLNKNDKRTIEGLNEGTYMYNAFNNDENIKGGKVILK